MKGRRSGAHVQISHLKIHGKNWWGITAVRDCGGKDYLEFAVREQIHVGCDQVKIMATGGVMTPGVNSEGHRFHKKSASHAQGAEGILNAVLGGVDSIEHGIFMDERCLEEMKARAPSWWPRWPPCTTFSPMRKTGCPPLWWKNRNGSLSGTASP